jgi:hypothetical protein
MSRTEEADGRVGLSAAIDDLQGEGGVLPVSCDRAYDAGDRGWSEAELEWTWI